MSQSRQLTWHLGLAGAIGAIVLAACSSQIISPTPSPLPNALAQLKPVTLDQTKIVTGQTVYVPAYAYIYHYNSQNHVINLATTLSLRNTDRSKALIIAAVRYYNGNGQLVKQYLEKPVELKPLASTDVFIETDNVVGGLGASFIVEWVAETAVTEPVIEAVMISSASAQGISFVSVGRVLKRYGTKD